MDYTRGLAGTGEFDYAATISSVEAVPSWEYVKGWLAESFEMPENGIWILNIRKGVHFALDPASEASRLVNGREMTADDAKFSLEIIRDTPNSRHNLSRPAMMKNMTVEKTGPWQITVRTPVDAAPGYAWLMGGGGVQYVWAKEWLEKYGKINEWRNVVGTGPYMLTDFISGSVATLRRNPNYWRKDPVTPGKGNQLPYPDGVKLFIIPDLSTRLATMRTGKGDLVEAIEWEDAGGLIKTTPSLRSRQYLPKTFAVAMRTDKEDLPYSKIKVRQALTIATDFEAIKTDLYGGKAETYTLPVDSSAKHIFWPIEKLPSSVQALYKYNPEKAKQLLAEAGYPNGLKANMIVQSTTSALDLASVVKAMWAKVGVDVEIQPRETAVFLGIQSARSYGELMLTTPTALSTLSPRFNFTAYRGTASNFSYVNDPPGKDPNTEKAFQIMSENFMVNPLKADQAIRDWIPHVLEQAYYIALPAPYTYRIWQPWLKGYYGEGAIVASGIWAAHPWIDQDLKEQMTGRR
ncbi:MAG: ABC transporter substrate-binding protein [Chloroflexi bacterium]|nr:ABC transporter substrate-binding protein [Chloroflexota bacterium]